MWAPLPHLKKELCVGERREPAPCPHCSKFCMETLWPRHTLRLCPGLGRSCAKVPGQDRAWQLRGSGTGGQSDRRNLCGWSACAEKEAGLRGRPGRALWAADRIAVGLKEGCGQGSSINSVVTGSRWQCRRSMLQVLEEVGWAPPLPEHGRAAAGQMDE